MIEDKLKEILAAGLEAAVALQKCGLTKEEVKPLADAGNLDAAIVLLLGETSRKIGDTWVEDFEDEDTHRVVQVERHNYSDEFIFEPDTNELQELGSLIAARIPFENMPVILPHLLSDLADNYAQQLCGFPKDKEKARMYYNKALEAGWEKETYDSFIEMLDYDLLEHPQDLADDFDPRNATIMISGHPLYLDQIENMVEDLTKAHGDPGNDIAIFVPLQYLFKTLGFDWVDNTGNLMGKWRRAESVLTLEIECNPHVDEALVEAFQKAYPKLTVELVENE